MNAHWNEAGNALGAEELLEALLERHLLRPAVALEPLPGPGPAPPLVVLVSIDTLRADSLTLYGSERATSPALDRLGADSLVFGDVLAPAPFTIASHATLLTSLDADVVWERHLKPLPERAITLAEVLRDAGFATGAVVNTHHLDRKFGFDQGFESFEHDLGRKDGPENVLRAERFLAANRDRPRFLFLHVFDAHSPYASPAPWDTRYLDPPPPPDGVPEYLRRLDYHHHLKSLRQADSVAAIRALYDGGVARVDRLLGEFFAGLEARGEYEEALVIVTSDHGEDFYDHGVWIGHGLFLYQSELRIPLIVKLPRRLGVEPGRVESPVGLVDVMPTVLDVLGVPAPPGLQGSSLMRFVTGSPPDADALAIFASSPHTGSYAVRRGRWKYIEPLHLEERLLFERHLRPEPEVREELSRRIDWGAQLYDLERDPEETTNLIETHPEVAAELAALAERRRARNQVLEARLFAVDPVPDVELSEAERAELEALGYVH